MDGFDKCLAVGRFGGSLSAAEHHCSEQVQGVVALRGASLRARQEAWRGEPANYRLDRMSELRVSDSVGTRPRDFDLDSYAARSFGVFQEEPHDVVLHFLPEVTEEVAAFQFHPSQTITREADGSTTVRFRAGGLREMAWHLFTSCL
jgi:predicted DNA-binding transcriptional regulator YafY